jgi:hypothetical protein
MTHTFKLSRRTARLRPAFLPSLLVLALACDSTEPFEPTVAESALQPSFAVTSSSISISNISARSGRTYRVGWDLSVGDVSYVDRSYTYASSIPSAVAGLAYIQTANSDKDVYVGSTSFLSFDISTDAVIYVGHDDRLARPSWLTSSFQDTGLNLTSSDGSTKYSLFKRSFPRGRVTLGSNLGATAGPDQSMYVVLVQPAPSTAPVASTGTVTGTGIPFGYFHLPNGSFGSVYNGAVRNIWPAYLLDNLSQIKARGGKVTLSLSGSQANVRDAEGNFSLTKWKAQVDRFRSVNFSSYIKDGTIIGHYLLDEPSDKADWNGVVVPPEMVEEMARYSKSIWPDMITIVRAWPTFMDNWSGTYTYLDAAWAQYRVGKGPAATVLATEVAAAKLKGLALIIGLNVLKGGYNGGPMTASEVESWGSTWLNDTYTCGFISWQYDDAYLGRSDVKTAMARLSEKAKARSFKTCRGA